MKINNEIIVVKGKVRNQDGYICINRFKIFDLKNYKTKEEAIKEANTYASQLINNRTDEQWDIMELRVCHETFLCKDVSIFKAK